MTAIQLPELDDLQLEQLFGTDEPARRRYAIVRALSEGTPQREVALRFAVSERTVRAALQLARRGGLDALRSHPVSRRRSAAQRTIEQAVRRAFEEAPLSGGDRIWRRVRSLISPELAPSRRTVYRLLAELRASMASSVRQQHAAPLLVRQALSLIDEDPPRLLGESTLAQQLLPQESDALRRGRVLQQALHSAIEALRPPGVLSSADHAAWPYLIVAGEYLEGRLRAELLRDLALSSSSYTRAKASALQRIADRLPALIGNSRVDAGELPRTADFMGRGDDQAYYGMRLHEEGLALIWGLAGSGKTALAAELAAQARRFGQLVLWHQCRPGSDASVAGIVRGLAGELARYGEPALLRGLPEVGTASAADLLDRLHNQLAEQQALIVLDDLQRAQTDPAFADLLSVLLLLRSRQSLRLLLISRTHLTLFEDWAALEGLREPDARLILSLHGVVQLAPETWHSLYRRSAGLPAALRAVAQAIRHGQSWEAALERWINETIWDRLAAPQQTLLAALQTLGLALELGLLPLLLAELDLEADALSELLHAGLLVPEQDLLRIHPIMAGPAETRAQADLLLHEHLAAFRRRAGASTREREQEQARVWSGMRNPPLTPPVAPAWPLPARLRAGLERTISYLRSQTDPYAQQLAAELEQIQRS